MFKCVVLAFSLALTIGCVTYNEGNIRTAPETDLREEAFERARALHYMNEHRAALRTLDKILSAKPIDELSVDAVLLAAEICVSQKNPQKALDLIDELQKKAGGKIKDSARLDRMKEKLNRSLAKVEDTSPLLTESKKVNDEEKAEPLASDSSAPTQKVIGVLLPLTGSFEVYGKRALTAMSIAFGATGEEKEDGAIILKNDDGLKVVVLDTRGVPDFARSQVDVLVDRYNAPVVVGDILSDTSLAIASQTEKRNAINISLSRRDGVTKQGSHVFHFAATPKKQVQELLRAQRAESGKLRYAVLYPENGFGTELKDAFILEAKAQGHSVVKVVGYQPNETTFTNHVRQLAGAKKTTGNPNYEECLERVNRIKDGPARKKAEKDCYDAVVPTVAFDALFVPEFPKTLSYIVPALISEGIMVSQNEDMVRAYRRTSRLSNAVPVQLLGPSGWNNALVGQKLGVQVDGALFVDSADLAGEGDSVKKFVKEFTDSTQSPPSIGEAYAFDAMQLAKSLFGSKGEQRPLLGRITRALEALNHDGIIGKIAFDSDRELIVPFRRFSFQEGKIVPQS